MHARLSASLVSMSVLSRSKNIADTGAGALLLLFTLDIVGAKPTSHLLLYGIGDCSYFVRRYFSCLIYYVTVIGFTFR